MRYNVLRRGDCAEIIRETLVAGSRRVEDMPRARHSLARRPIDRER